jgi:hypothetical protein
MLKYIYSLIFLAIIALASCNKDTTITPAFTFTNGGNAVSGNNYKATYSLNPGTYFYAFTGNFYESNSSTYVQLIFSSTNYIVPGTYQCGGTYPARTTGSLNLYVGSTQYETSTGSFQITSLDTVKRLISGTFQFNGVSVVDSFHKVSVTNGSFSNINYTAQ